MPGMHIGESFHGTLQVMERKPPQPQSSVPETSRSGPPVFHPAWPAASSAGSTGTIVADRSRHSGEAGHFIGSLNPGAVAAASGTPTAQSTGDTVLRLRGGGGAHGKQGIDEDRERLMPGGSSHGGYREFDRAAIRAAAASAANAAKRQELQREFDSAKLEMRSAEDKYRRAMADSETTRADMRRLEDESRQTSGDPARQDEIARQLRAANDDYRARTYVTAAYHTGLLRCAVECRRLQRKLDRLPPSD